MTILSNRKQGPSTRRIDVSDGSFFLLPHDAAILDGLHAHAPLSADLVSRLREESRRHTRTLVQGKLLELQAAREHSRRELSLKLARRGFDQDMVDTVISESVEAGYVSDDRFARAFVESRLRRQPEGRAALSARLAARGVARDVSDRVIGELVDLETETEALERALEKVQRRTADPHKQIAGLVRKGFPYSLVKAYVHGN